MRKTLRASVFVLMLCAPTFAGVISNPSATQLPPPSMTTEEPATDGDTQYGAADGLTETVLSVLGSVLALL